MKRSKVFAVIISILVFAALFSLLINAFWEDPSEATPTSSHQAVVSRTDGDALWDDFG